MTATASRHHLSPAGRPAALACRHCRRSHLKCDGQTPTCARCSRQGTECVYTPSRRGLRARQHRIASSAARSGPHDSLSTTEIPQSLQLVGTSTISGAPVPHSHDPGRPVRSETASGNATLIAEATEPACPREPNEQYLTNLFYSHFHPTHPFLVPRGRYTAQSHPSYLRQVVQFVGSHFASNFSTYIRPTTIATALESVREPSTPLVQSLLLFAIAMHSRNERDTAFKTIDRAASLAIDLGMHKDDYAQDHGGQDPLIEQSLRRTWWELYVVDGFFAALHRQTTFRCNTVHSSTYLPCEEFEYREGMTATSLATLDQMDQRFFMLNDQRFSSGSYRVEAIRIIARVISAINAGEDVADNIQAVDNAIVAWKYHLPREKAGIIDRTGTFDQMMLQGHMFIHCAGILLHFSRSELLLNLPTIAKIPCSERITHASPTSNQHAHKAVTASKSISDLVTLPAERYSPLFVCGLAFGCLVQLAVCSTHACNCVTHHRERVALMIGVLKCTSQEWPISGRMLQPLKRIASSVFGPKVATNPATTTQSLESGSDGDSTSSFDDWLDLFCLGNFGANDGQNLDVWNIPSSFVS